MVFAHLCQGERPRGPAPGTGPAHLAALVTKSTMIVRDRDILRQLAGGPGALVMFSITTVDPAIAREIEPDVPPPQRRLEAMRALAEAGIPTGVLLAPVLPGITDGEAGRSRGGGE